MSLSLDQKTEALRKIKEEILAKENLPLYSYRTSNHYFPVIGEGSHEASIMFVGEAPGKNEALTGRPFCGAAGKVLDEILKEAGLEREEIYITNIVKDRPPENRDPLPEEIESYSPYLDRQIEILEPKVIATLGRFSMKYILEKFKVPESSLSIGRLHGQVFETKTSYGRIVIIPLYHPAAAIYDRSKVEDLKKDIKILKKYK